MPDSHPRIHLLFAHPSPDRSRIQRLMFARALECPGVSGEDLYERYPDFDVDVDAEQARVREADLIVFQHPLYWYSVPPLLKQWIDLVLEHGWAYGRAGVALRGKSLLSAVTTGGGEEAYVPGGFNAHTVREFLAPIEYTARLCGMRYLPPFVAHGMHRADDAAREAVAADYVRLLEALRDGQIALDDVRDAPVLRAPAREGR